MNTDIRQLIDLEKVDALLEGFNKSTGFVSAIIDLEGNVLSKSGWRTICTEFHRINPETSKRCTFSDTVLANNIEKSEKYHAYQCLNGLMDVAVPLKIKGEHIANLFSGQFFFEEPDVEFFRKQAAAFGFDEKKYLDALSKVPGVSEEKVKAAMDFLLNMTEFISDLTIQKLEQAELIQNLRDNEQKLETSNQQLEASEQQLRNVLENTGSVFYSHTTDHKITFFSPQIEEILGYTSEEVMIKWTELASDNPINEIGYNHTVKAIETGKRQAVYELELVRKDGKKVFVEVNESPVVKNGKTVAISGSLADITERKHAEEELKQNEEKYRLLFANNPQPMWIYDLETLAFLEVNEAAVNHYGYSREEFLTMTLKDIRPVEDIPALLEDIKNTRSELNTAGQWRHLKKNGEIIDVEITSHSLSFNDRKARHILINDITERQRAENEISKLSRAVEQSPTSIIMTDLDGKIEYINPKTLEITGYTKEELIGKNPRIFNSGEKQKEDYQQLWSALLSGREWTGEFHNKKKNGGLYWESASISPIINEKQEVINFVAVKEDITERKRLEATQKLLLEISELATKHVTITSFLAEVHQKLKQIVRADNFYVALYNDTDHTFSFPYHVDEFDKLKLNTAYDFRNSYTDYVLKSNQSLSITPDYQLAVEKDGKINGYGSELSVWLGVPFQTKEGHQPNGVIAIQDYQNVESYTETDRSIMEIIAHHIGRFIERIQHLEELVRAKEKAEANQLLFETIFESAPVGIALFDAQSGKFLKINRNYPQLLGYSKNEMIGLDFMQISHPEDLPDDLSNMEKLRNGEITYFEMEKRLYSKSGQVIHTNLIVIPLGISESPMETHLAIVQDITNDKQMIAHLEQNNIELIAAKEKAEESEGKLIEAQELSHVGSWEYFFDTDTITWSKELFNIFERSCDLPAPKFSAQRPFYTKESFARLDKAVQDCIRHEIPYEIELDIITSSGAVKQIISNGNVLKDINDKLIGCYGTAQDITERKIIENELIKAKEKAEESDRLKTAFLANMSHEIRTPMNGILGFTELLLEPDLSSEEKEAYINIVNQSGQRMLNTVNDIVEISKIEAGIVTVNLKEVNVQEILLELIRFFTPEATKKGLKLTLENEVPKTLAVISTDKNKLDSILSNLIKNAIKYTESGTIKVGCTTAVKTHCNASLRNASLQFYVKDTGIGIPEKRQHAVFDRFVQADMAITRQFDGSGLGLAITKAYVNMLGGEIGLESKAGEGSTFFFSLPFDGQVIEKTAEEAGKQEDKTSPTKGLHILIAEDDWPSAHYLQIILKNGKHKILLTQDGHEAVEACRNNPDIDLVLMDIQMPEMDGYEATRQIREFNKDVVIIAQTAHAFSGDKEKARAAGCDDYISKPIKKVVLFEKMQKHLKKMA